MKLTVGDCTAWPFVDARKHCSTPLCPNPVRFLVVKLDDPPRYKCADCWRVMQ